MTDYKLIEKIPMDCPICGRSHDVELREKLEHIIIKGEYVQYVERYYFCEYADEDESEFAFGGMMDENLENARRAYDEKKKDESINIHLSNDDIIYLSCTLALMMASMEAYNLNPEEESFYDGGISMQNVFVKKMKELGVGEATIGAIVAECGGCYGCTYDGSEEDEDLIEFFLPENIKKRLEERDK